jgi:hypothetical protein
MSAPAVLAAVRTFRRLPASALVLLCLPVACGGAGTKPSPVVSPSPSPTDGVIPGLASGPTRITFTGAEPPPGAHVGGCGATIVGCRGRVRIQLALQPSTGGPVLYVRVFLHSMSQRACLIGQTGPLVLQAGTIERIDVVLDQADDCRTPVDIRTMAAVVEGTVEVASRQEWGITYTFSP